MVSANFFYFSENKGSPLLAVDAYVDHHQVDNFAKAKFFFNEKEKKIYDKLTEAVKKYKNVRRCYCALFLLTNPFV